MQAGMHEATVVDRIGWLIERPYPMQLEDVPGMYCVGIAKPGLDLGHRKLARPQRHRWRWPGWVHRLWSDRRLIECSHPEGGGMLREADALRTKKRL